MTLQLEHEAIEAYIKANWTTTIIGMDGHEFKPIANSIRIKITSGAVLQGSIGRIANVMHNIGTVTATIYVRGGKGSNTWRGYAEALQTLFHGVSITSTGSVANTVGGVFVRFSPPQLSPNEHPYIAADFPDPPFHIVNVIAPFVRYSTR